METNEFVELYRQSSPERREYAESLLEWGVCIRHIQEAERRCLIAEGVKNVDAVQAPLTPEALLSVYERCSPAEKASISEVARIALTATLQEEEDRKSGFKVV